MKVLKRKLKLNLEVVAILEVEVKLEAVRKKWEGKKAGDVGGGERSTEETRTKENRKGGRKGNGAYENGARHKNSRYKTGK
jgi:hypothetical protein